jgi:DNA processing protein
MAAGCHYLIRQGTILVENPQQILEELSIPYDNQSLTVHAAGAVKRRQLDKSAKILLDALGFEPASLDSLVARTGLGTTEVTVSLLFLELEQLVSMQPGGRYVRLVE